MDVYTAAFQLTGKQVSTVALTATERNAVVPKTVAPWANGPTCSQREQLRVVALSTTSRLARRPSPIVETAEPVKTHERKQERLGSSLRVRDRCSLSCAARLYLSNSLE